MPPKAKLHKEKGKLKSIPKVVNQPENLNSLSSTTGNSSSNSTEIENQVQFEVELTWCIQQLQLALSSGKLNEKQTQDITKTLNTLMSNSTPLIKKRQLMRLKFDDYRAKMAEEEKKYMKMNRRIVLQPGTPSKKSVFVKKAPFLQSGKDFKFNFQISEDISKLNIDENTEKKVEDRKEASDFHFQPSNNTFRFNFTGNNE